MHRTRSVPTVGQAVVTMYAAGDWQQKYPRRYVPIPYVISDGSEHAEQKVVNAIITWIWRFKKGGGNVTSWLFDFSMVIGLSPCPQCKQPHEFLTWIAMINRAIGYQLMRGYPLGSVHRIFRLDWWYVKTYDYVPTYADGEPRYSLLVKQNDSRWDTPGDPVVDLEPIE